MEGRGRSRARKKRFFSPKRLTSFLLAAAMVFTNVGADLSTAFAADSTDVSFEMRGADLVAAIEDAVASENVVAPDDLNFTNGNVEKFEDFLFGDGKLYEAYPEMDGGDVETELRVFVRLPESADDMYAVTGDEEVIFLYVNNSDETVRFRSYISYTKDGEEEIKRTDSVTVRSYESAYGDEEVNVISDPVEVPETEESTEAPETAAPETEVPAEEPETEIPADETVTAPEEETPAEETAGEEDPVATESEMKVSFSRNEAALVAAPAGDDPKATPSEMEDSKDPEESNEGLVDEGNMPNEKDPADVPGESAPAEESTPADETTVTGEPQVPETTVPEPQVPETTAPETTPAATPSETAPEKKPDAPKPSYSDLVGIGWSGTAKMYTSTLNKLHAFEDVDGWQIQYSIDPEGSARIVDGPRGVEDGEDLYFGVKNQLGYAVETVLANGEELAADTITDNEDGSQTAWYTVYGVTEEQNIDVVMAETGEHPGFSQEIQMDDGMVITIQADEGVLPDGVTATAERAGEDVENAVAEQATEDGKAITSVKAYDISLWLDGQLLDSAIWGGSRKVEVTFSGAAVEEQSAQANTLEIVHVETAQAAQPRMRLMTAAAPAASVTGIDQVKAVEVPEGQTVSAISFEAEHFSIYAVVGGVRYEDRYTMQVGETIRLRADDVYAFDGGYWTSSDRSVVEITRQEGSLWNPYADVTAKRASSESVWITYHYGVLNWQQQTFKISVKQADTATAYFYILKPNGDKGSLQDADWLYVGTGKIKTDNLINQYGGPLEPGKEQFALNIEDKIISSPEDAHIKEQIAELYGIKNPDDAEISYTPYKISYPNGYKDEEGNPQLGDTYCYHVDMSVSVETNTHATANFYLWDAGGQGFNLDKSEQVKKGENVSPEQHDKLKTVDGNVYEFKGWYDSKELTGNPVRFPYKVTEAVNFYAKYEPKEMVTIEYKVVNGGAVTNDRETFAADAGEDAAKGSKAVKTHGYVFKGWYDNDKGTETPLDTGYGTFKPKRPGKVWEDAIYYAVFEKIKESEIDDPYVEIDDVDNDKEYYQGSVNVKVYLDGKKVEENSGTIHYGYERYNCVDLKLTYPENEEVVLNAIYAKQVEGLNKPQNITAGFVDNVKDGSTVYIYLSSVYTVEYTVDGEKYEKQDDTKYTLPKYPRWKQGYSRYVNGELKDYETEYIEVKSLPEKEGYTFDGWFDKDSQKVTPNSQWALNDAVAKADDKNIIKLNATSKLTGYKYDLIVNYWDEAGNQVIPGLHEGNYFEEGEVYRLYDVVHKELTGKDGNHYVRIIPDDTVLAGIAEEGDANFKDGAIVIDAIYALDNLGGTEEKPGDGIPDKYQVTVKYVSDDYGYVTVGDRSLMTEVVTLYKHGEPAEGWALPTDPEAKGRTTGDGIYATPKEGYSFVNWTYPITDSENGVISTAAPGVIEVTGDLTVTAHFEETKYELFVEHVYYDADGNKVEEIWEKDTNQLAEGTLIEEELQEKTGYVFESIDTDRADGQELEYNFDDEEGVFISSMPDTPTYVQFNYVADANGDQIPDKYQDTIVFVAVNGTFDENGTTQLDKVITYTNDGTAAGKLDAEGKYTLTAEDIPAAMAAEGYAQDSLKWDDPAPLGYTIFSTVDAENNPSNKVFIVRFEPEEAETQTYTIHHLEERTDKVLAEDVVETAAVGSVIDGKDKQLSINGYAFVSATTLEVKADSEQNHVYVYYGKDSIGPDGDNDPDGEPDAYQIVFTFRSSDEAKGTLSGTTRQVYTFKDNDGNYVKPAEGISQRAVQQYLEGTMEGFEAVTITSKEGYEFDYWTVENQEVDADYTSTMDELGNTPFTQDTTFVVYFSSVGGSSENPGDDSGSGGNSGGGGGGSSSGPSGSGGSSTAGPGVTITDGDVPLAPLPSDGSGSSAVIYDDNVPLAPLPKTGQESLKAPLTALFAGIFLALASLKRRKEEN